MTQSQLQIHFIEKSRAMTPVQPGSPTWESGGWKVSEARARSFIGGRIYFHERKTEPSYFGGTIQAYRVLPEGHPNAGLVVFTFLRLAEAIGVRTDPDGWKLAQKLVGLERCRGTKERAEEASEGILLRAHSLQSDDYAHLLKAVEKAVVEDMSLNPEELHRQLARYRQRSSVWNAGRNGVSVIGRRGESNDGEGKDAVHATDYDFWRVLVEVVFYSGIDAAIVTAQLPAIRSYLGDYEKVAKYTKADVHAMVKDPAMLRSRGKISSCIKNSLTWMAVVAEHGSIANYLNGFGPLNHDASLKRLAKELTQTLSHIGPITVFHFLMEIGLPVVKPDRVMQRVLHRWAVVSDPKVKRMGDALEDHLWSVIDEARKFSAASGRTLREFDILIMALGQRKIVELGVTGICLEVAPRCGACHVRPDCIYASSAALTAAGTCGVQLPSASGSSDRCAGKKGAGCCPVPSS